ncbi:DUF533 domain-containing protein [Ovoidimarina sediminis]|uniref:DUF533 domain-containing protein n=1 Tax=Ovoidimarina sediminis TaxID=3079856 RepID=UPI002912DD77|nr:DUF533 domain-containing protein [Rhodophyticola sp. MJ-SS7]MDU8945390.1 DUF533 domain-containing protein [Rhodophyticola sp. MJ-SS7]
MSFVRTLAALAAGFAAAKGVEQYKKMGGLAGLQDAMKDNPALSNMQAQMGEMMERFGVPGGADGLKRMMDQWTGATSAGGEQAAAGLGSLLAALNGGAAAGAEQAAAMMDTLTGNSRTTETMEDNAKLMIRAMIQAAKADGTFDAEEQARLMDHLGELDADERAFVEAELAKPVDLFGLAADTSDAMKAQVYATSLMAVRVDTTQEAAYLDGLAAALGLSDETRARVHASMGAK